MDSTKLGHSELQNLYIFLNGILDISGICL